MRTLLTNALIAQPNNGILAAAVNALPASYPNPGGSPNFYISDAGRKLNSIPFSAYHVSLITVVALVKLY
jgi:hypothetical protein